MNADRDRCATWRALGGYLQLDAGRHRIGFDPGPDDLRRPSPYPLSLAAAREAIAAGMSVRHPDDLLARAA